MPLNKAFATYPVCPACKKSNYRKAGKNSHNGLQMLKCCSCGRFWTLSDKTSTRAVEQGLNDKRSLTKKYALKHTNCSRCGSSNLGFAGWCHRKSGRTRRLHCKDCNKYFPCPEMNAVPTRIKPEISITERNADACPRCQRAEIGSGGKDSKGHELSHCKTCDFRWVIYPHVPSPLPKLVCPDCGQQEKFIKGGTENELQRYVCKECRCTFIPSTAFIPKCPDCCSMRYRSHGYYSEQRYYRCQDCDRCYSASSKAKVSNDPFVIDARKFGASKQYHQGYKIDLNTLSPTWLRISVKKYIELRLGRGDLRFQTLKNRASLARKFGEFLEENYPGIEPCDIDRNLMLSLYTSSWWCLSSADTNRKFLVFIKDLFAYIEEYEWYETSDSMLVFREDYPKRNRLKTRHIPELVMSQIMENLPTLPEPFQRAIIVLSETGIRFSELSSLKKNCLEEVGEGTWWLNFYQHKMDKEHRVPISKKCAIAIQEQLAFIQKTIDPTFDFLFCGRSTQRRWIAKPLHLYPFNKAMQAWAESCQILDSDGKVWNLTSHQFRHTLATRMINAKVPITVVQRYLGHETSQMTQHYAHLHDQTLKEAIEEYYASSS